MIDIKAVKSEEKIRELIKNNFKKQYHPGTKPSVDFIYKNSRRCLHQWLTL